MKTIQHIHICVHTNAMCCAGLRCIKCFHTHECLFGYGVWCLCLCAVRLCMCLWLLLLPLLCAVDDDDSADRNDACSLCGVCVQYGTYHSFKYACVVHVRVFDRSSEQHGKRCVSHLFALWCDWTRYNGKRDVIHAVSWLESHTQRHFCVDGVWLSLAWREHGALDRAGFTLTKRRLRETFAAVAAL